MGRKRNTIDRLIRLHVRKTDAGCWEWTGGTDLVGGYGRTRVGYRYVRTHRYAWEELVGPTNGLNVLHKCDNRICMNPDHLFLGTHGDNLRDAIAKGHRREAAPRLPRSMAAVVLNAFHSGLSKTAIAKALAINSWTVKYIVEGS